MTVAVTRPSALLCRRFWSSGRDTNRDLGHFEDQSQRLIHSFFSGESTRDVGCEAHQVCAGSIAFDVLAPHTTFQELTQVIFGAQIILCQILLAHMPLAPGVSVDVH